MIFVFSFILENRRAINHIYHSVRREVFEQYLMRICDYTVTAWFDTASESEGSGLEKEGTDRSMVIRFIRYELFGACIDFMNEGMPPGAIEEAKKLLGLAVGMM